MFRFILISAGLIVPLGVNSGYVNIKNTEEQIECLAKNIYFEARGEPLVGQMAVGQVTLNRVSSPKFPNTVCQVIYQGKYAMNGIPIKHQCQFSWWCDGQPEIISNKKAYEDAYELATLLYNGSNIDITEGAIFYHSTKVFPSWAGHKQRLAQIEDHIFYR